MNSSCTEPGGRIDETRRKAAIFLVFIMLFSIVPLFSGIMSTRAYAADPNWEPGPREKIVYSSNELRDALLSNAVDKIYLGADIAYATAMPTLAGGTARPSLIIDGTDPRTDTKHTLSTTVSFRLGTASNRVSSIKFQNIKLNQASGANGFVSCASTTAALGTTITFENANITVYRTVLPPGANGTNNSNVNFIDCNITSTNAGATGTRMICGRYIEFAGTSTIDSYSGTSQGIFSVANQVSTSLGSTFTVKKGASLVVIVYASTLQVPLIYNLRGLDLKVEENAIFFVVAGNLGYTVATTDTTSSFEVDKNAICIMNLRGNRSRLRSQELRVNEGGILHLWANAYSATTSRMAVDAQRMLFNSPFQVVLATSGTTNNTLMRPSSALEAKDIKSIRYFVNGANSFDGYEMNYLGALRNDYRNWWFQQNGAFNISASNLGTQNSLSITTNYDPSGNTMPGATPIFSSANFALTPIHWLQIDGGSRAPTINNVFVGASTVTGTGQPGAYVTVTWPNADGTVSATPTTTVLVEAVPGLPIGYWRAEVPEDIFLNISDARLETQIKATQREISLGLDRGESYAVYEPVQGTAMKLIGSNARTIYYEPGTAPDVAEILFFGAGLNMELAEGKGRYLLTNTTVSDPGNLEAFEALWAVTDSAKKGFIEANNTTYWRTELCDIPANCTVWAIAEVKMGGSETAGLVYDTLIYNNLFEKKKISFRLLEGLPSDPVGSQPIISPYTEISGNYGIPRNLSGDVHTGLLVRYNTVNIGLNAYMSDYWTATAKNGADTPFTITLDPGFPAAYLDLSDDGEGLLYTLYINNTEQKKLGLWQPVPMAYVDKEGKLIPDSSGEPAMIWVPMDILEDDKEYGDDEEPDPPLPDITSSNFLLRGGRYTPLKHHPYTPVGYYVSQYSLDVRDEPPGDPAKLKLCGDFSKDFNPEITDIGFIPPEKFYIVFAEGITEIREIHLDKDDLLGATIYPDIRSVANIEFAKPAVRYTAPKVADYVPVGWEIRNLNQEFAGGFVYGSDPDHFPTMDQNGLVFTDISAEMISLGFDPAKPEELEIHWLYAKDLNNNGIPDDEEAIINAFWNGIHPGFDFAVPLNRTITATRFGYDFTITNDASKDGNPKHIIELDSGASKSNWLFDTKVPDNEAKVTIKPPDSTIQTVIFWYSLTTDATLTIKAIEKDVPANILKEDVVTDLIAGQTYAATAPYIDETWVLAGNSLQTVTIDPGRNQIVFEYEKATGNLTVILREVDHTGSPVTPENNIRVISGQYDADGIYQAPDLRAAYYTAYDSSDISIIYTELPKTVYIGYTKDLLDVMIVPVDQASGLPIPGTSFSAPKARKGEMYGVSVALPSISGYTLAEPAGKLVYADPSADPLRVEFQYRKIEDTGFITVTVAGKAGERELYSYPKRIAQTDLPYTLIDGIDLFALPGYALSPGQNHLVTGEGTYTFTYITTEGTVKISLQEEGSGNILAFFYEPATVGEPFTYNAPNLSGYKLVNLSSIGVVTNVLPGGASEIIFKYAKIQSPVTVVYKEDISGRVIRVVEVIPPVIGDDNIVLTPDLGDPDFYTAKQLSVSYDYDGVNPVEVEALYSKDLVDIPIIAMDYFTDATDPPLGAQSPILNQRKGEVTTVTAPTVPGYVLVGSNTRQVIALANPETFRYRNTVDAVGVTVNVYAGSKSGPVIQTIVILAAVGETVAVDPTSIKLAGYIYNASHPDNRLNWQFGDPDSGDGTDIRVIMTDIRAALNIYTKLGTAAPTLNQSELLVTPYTKTVNAPNLDGWVVVGYQIDDEPPVTTGSVSSLTLTDITASITNLTFLYQKIAEKYVTVTIKGVSPTATLYSYNKAIDVDDLPYTLIDGVDIPITSGDYTLDPGQDHEISGSGTYTFTYSLSAEHNSALSSLSVSNGALDPVFAPGTLTYAVTVTGIDEITISATAAGAIAGTGTFELELGENDFAIVVTAPCGESEHTTTYTVKVILTEPGYHDSSLTGLTVSDGALDPLFAPGNLAYTVTVSGIDEITISATAAGAITGTGTFELELGENTFNIVVTAPCGESEHKTTYTVTVILTEPEVEPLVIIGGNTLLTAWPVSGAMINIPIEFRIEGDFDQVLSAGYSFKLSYDTSILEFTSPVLLNDPDGAFFILINQNPLDPLGTLTVLASANYPKTIDLADSHLILLPFKVIGDPARNDSTALTPSSPGIMKENPLDGNYLADLEEVIVVFGGGSSRIKGDINNDGMVTPEDAMLLLQWLVGLPTPGVVWDAETLWAANIKGYGEPDPSDAALILRMVSGA